MQTLFDVIVPVFLVIGFGYVSVWRGYFSTSAADGLMRFAQSFAIPCLLFQAIARLDLSASYEPALMISFYFGAGLCFALGIFGARLLLKRDWEDCVAIGFCCLFSNSVLLGLPITERAYGTQALAGNFAIVSIHAPFCYGLGITVMEFVRGRGQSPKKLIKNVARAMFRNALVLAILAGFAMNLSGLSLPIVLDDALSLVARAALPAALFALGGALVQYRPEGDTKAIIMVCTLSLLIHPTIVWFLGSSLSLASEGFRSAVVTSAMAPGINAYVFANIYGRALRVAAASVLVATGLSILTVWFWLSLLA